jgi:hypothetical protein
LLPIFFTVLLHHSIFFRAIIISFYNNYYYDSMSQPVMPAPEEGSGSGSSHAGITASSVAVSEAELARIGRSLSSCMLDRYAITTGAVVLGTVLGLKKKNLRPFVSCVTIGTLGDLAYGYFYCCKDNIREYMDAKAAFDLAKKNAPSAPK